MSCGWTLLSHILTTKVLYPTKQSGQGLLFQLIRVLFFLCEAWRFADSAVQCSP